MKGAFIGATPRKADISPDAETRVQDNLPDGPRIIGQSNLIERDEDGKPMQRGRMKTFTRSEKYPHLNGVFAKFLEDGTPYLSPSQIRKVLTCGFDWAGTYLHQRPTRTSVAMEFGTNQHGVLEVATRAHMDGTILDENTLVEMAESAAMKRFTDPAILNNLRDPENADPAALASLAKQCIKSAWTWYREEELTPLAMEEQLIYRVQVPHPITQEEVTVAILGYPDLYARTPTGRHAIIDYKHTKGAPSRDLQAMQSTHGMTYNEAKNNKDESLDIYSRDRGYFHALLTYADALQSRGIPVDEVWAVYVTKTKNSRTIPIKMDVTPEMLSWARVVSKSGMKKVLHRDLDPDPFSADWKCKTCDNRDACPAAAHILEGNASGVVA